MYLHKYTLRTHLKYECGKAAVLQCPECPHRSKLKGNLKKHILNMHNFNNDAASEAVNKAMQAAVRGGLTPPEDVKHFDDLNLTI